MDKYAILTFEEPESFKLIRLFRQEMEKMDKSDSCIKIIIDEDKPRVSIECTNRKNAQEYTTNKMKEMLKWLSGLCEESIKVDDENEKDITKKKLSEEKACFTYNESVKLFRVYTKTQEDLVKIMRSLHSLLGRPFQEKQPENMSAPLAAAKCPEQSQDSKTKSEISQSMQIPRTSMSTSKTSKSETIGGQQETEPKVSGASLKKNDRKEDSKDHQNLSSDDKQAKAMANQGAESSTLISLPGNDQKSSIIHKTDPKALRLHEDFKLNITLEDGLIFRIFKANITTICSGAIVNPANELLRNTGGAADAISKAAGTVYENDCQHIMKKKKCIKTTENVLTKSGNLPCAVVINAVGPQWADYKDKLECLRDLEKTITGVLETAEKNRIDSIAIPPISSGIFGVPWELCAPMYISSITKFGSKKRKHLQEVNLVDLTDDILDLSCKYYKEWTKHKKLDPKQILQEFAAKNPQAMSGPTMPKEQDKNGLSTENPISSLCKFLGNSKDKQTFEMSGKLKVYIYRDDLVKIGGIDMLVSPENSAFTGNGALAQSILKSAGSSFRQIHQSIQHEVYTSRKSLKPGDFRVTYAGNLKYRFVFHVVFNRFSDQRPPSEIELKDLKFTVKKILNHVECYGMCNMKNEQYNMKITSIAMPLLGAGGIENPKYLEKICCAVYDAIEEYVETSRMSNLKEIHLVSYVESTNTAFTNTFLAMSKQDYVRSRQKPPTQKPTAENPKYQEELNKALSPVDIWKMDGKRKSGPDLKTFIVDLKKLPPENCVICMDTFTNPVKLRKCNHAFCKQCITDFFSFKSACPVCNTTYGTIYGDQPRNGTATIYLEKTSLPGHKDGTYTILYDFPDGIQEECHPHPGTMYKGTRRQAYLPASKEGTAILHMLERAFKQGLIFTVGSSRTTGRSNVVTWNDIHHKTRSTGGPERFGYPDPDYLLRVREELEAKGITERDDREQQ
ncbi:uncharacterized protein LOC134260456 [Saccostrea cucullata]|uniref:uncharacterized protein LOC134260456 n=1 Tax=Saccostrea cuccullata TaxID=36930 RepID=UPI002ED30CFC